MENISLGGHLGKALWPVLQVQPLFNWMGIHWNFKTTATAVMLSSNSKNHCKEYAVTLPNSNCLFYPFTGAAILDTPISPNNCNSSGLSELYSVCFSSNLQLYSWPLLDIIWPMQSDQPDFCVFTYFYRSAHEYLVNTLLINTTLNVF